MRISENEEEITGFTKKRGRDKEMVGEQTRNFGQNIYPREIVIICLGGIGWILRTM